MSNPTPEQVERARVRAEARAKDKLARAEASGMVLPDKKRKRGWEILRERLKQGTLLPSLREISDVPLGTFRGVPARHGAESHGLGSVLDPLRNKALKKANRKSFMIQAKALHEVTKGKRLERAERRKLIKKQKKLERELEYLNFPTILGWYFDGFFTPYFQLNEDYATIFNQMEIEISKNKEKSIKETFAEYAKRYFWPPEILGGFCFRTRGIYLDFREIMKDPPHTPPEIILDQRVEAVTLFVATEKLEVESFMPSEDLLGGPASGAAAGATGDMDFAAEEARMQILMKQIEDNPNMTEEEKAIRKRALLTALKKKKQRSQLQMQVAEEMHLKAINKNNFYFDDQIPGFFKKNRRDRDKYYFDNTWDIWRIKRKIMYFPNDFFWDEQLGLFFPKDRTRPPDYYLYDPNIAAYRVSGVPAPPNWRGIKPSHFYFDHKIGKWIKNTNAPAGTTPSADQNGMRYCLNKDKDTPDDFYFDILTQQFEKKVADKGRQYFYDPDFGAWRKINTPKPPKGSSKPIDFYWNEVENTFLKKDAPASFFAWDSNNNFFRKKKPLHGRYHPKNWIWVEKKKQWEPKKTASHYPLVSDSLYWRPDRDYDKPWLEYVGGFRDYHIDYDYERLSDEEESKVKGAGAKAGKPDVATVTTHHATTASTAPATTGGGGGGGGGAGGKSGGKKLQFSTSEPSVSGRDDKKGKQPSPSQSETLMFVDTLDRKTLKVTNLGGAVTDVDLRKYFGSVKKVIRPKKPGTDVEEDYAYLRFKTDEAAAAALKTMHNQDVKGQKLQLAYKAKAEDETVGGQKDFQPPTPGVPVKKIASSLKK